MLNVTINLDRMHCNSEFDSGSSSEPYLWTIFFHLDINTISQTSPLITYTPHSNWTTRGMYPDDVDAGDDVPIPQSMGNYSMTLDDGGLGIGLAGVMFVLLEQDSTDGNAIKAGHEEFASAAHRVLNDFILARIPTLDMSDPKASEIKTMADEIKSAVKSAIKKKVDWYEYLDDQDDFVGFGYLFLGYETLKELSEEANNISAFSASIRQEIELPNSPFLPPITLVNDYDVFGSVESVSLDLPIGPWWPELEQYENAVVFYKDINNDIDKIKDKLKDASSKEAKGLLKQLNFKKKTMKPLAIKNIGATRAVYDSKRDSINSESTSNNKKKKKIARNNSYASNMFVEPANIGKMTLDTDLSKKMILQK